MDADVADAILTNRNTKTIMIVTSVLGLLLGLAVIAWNLAGMTRGLNGLSGMIAAFARGTLDVLRRLHSVETSSRASRF